jgi:hypothetical protein
MSEITRPRESTVKRLFARSMNRCAFPECNSHVVDEQTGTVIAQICHIHAQSDDGPRFAQELTREQVHAFDNLILMCPTHHKIIDAPENIPPYTAERLREIKVRHEAADTSSSRLPELNDKQVATFISESTIYEQNSTHLDFRHAVFRVGGEGGGPGGGGGGGGQLVIVGSNRVPPQTQVDLSGGDGKFPGGGGGGAGTITFIGRELEAIEHENGFRISSFFTANSAHVDGFMHVLGGAWTHFSVTAPLPARTPICILAIVELGDIAEDARVRLTIDALDPNGRVAALKTIDVDGLPSSFLTPRRAFSQILDLDVDTLGVWEFRASSGPIKLATLSVEFRGN